MILSLGFQEGFTDHCYRILTTDEIVQHIENVGFKIDDIKKLNPLKMMPHFFLLASVPDIESDYES